MPAHAIVSGALGPPDAIAAHTIACATVAARTVTGRRRDA